MTYYENGKFTIGKGELKGKISAELSKEEKNQISHRRKALENLEKQLTNK